MFTKIRINDFVRFYPTGNVDAAKSAKKLLNPFTSLTCGMLKIALDIKLQFYLASVLSVEITSLVNRCITVIISAGITLVASQLGAKIIVINLVSTV